MSPKRIPRGIRNHNPGNIRHGSAKWQGLAAVQSDPEFCVFSAPHWGLRALARLLLTYRRRYHLTTTRQLIGRWAPPSENDTGAYVAVVAKALGLKPDAEIPLDFWPSLVAAIVRHENGQQPYSAGQIAAAVDAARER